MKYYVIAGAGGGYVGGIVCAMTGYGLLDWQWFVICIPIFILIGCLCGELKSGDF